MSILFPNPSFGIAALRLTPWTTNSNPFTGSGKIQFHIQLEFSLACSSILFIVILPQRNGGKKLV